MSVVHLKSPKRAVRAGIHRDVEYELTVALTPDEKLLVWTFAVDDLEAGELHGQGHVAIAARVEAGFTAAQDAALLAIDDALARADDRSQGRSTSGRS